MRQLTAIKILFLAGGLICAGLTTALAERSKSSHEPPFTIWDVTLGGSVTDLPERDLAEIACGTNGGPPSRPLDDLSNFQACPPEEDGRREIYFSYDDELEYRALALELPTEAALYAGTTVAGHAIVASVLVTDEGRIDGIRIVTDDRADIRMRRQAASLATTLKSRFDGAWSCQDLPPASGEEPLSGVFINQTCEQTGTALGDLFLETRYMRKKGQRSRDPVTGRPVKGAFESITRFEQRKP